MLKILTVRQPWATLLLREKDVENRSWYTHHRGWTLVHAAKNVDASAEAAEYGNPRTMVRGAVIGAINITSITHTSTSRWAEPGMYHWRHDLRYALTFTKPIPWTGRIKLTTVPDELISLLPDEHSFLTS